MAAVGFWDAPLVGSGPRTPLDFGALLGGVLLATGALATAIMHRDRLTAVLMLGLVGLVTALLFAHFSAPDLALTQLLVEIATVILLLLAMFFLPQETPAESGLARAIRDTVLAGVGRHWGRGAQLRDAHPAGGQHLILLSRRKQTGGGGTNVVNVILVDFRGFDTLGEITVLGIAAVGIFAMLQGLVLPGPQRDWLGRPWVRDRHPVVLVSVSKLLLPIALLVSAVPVSARP